MKKYICIHGHFYQPPRENAWLEEIEVQPSAYPYHDWNERITEECYAPNTHSRILNGGEKIIDIVNNYARISFNFGPTLLSWMEQRARETYDGIIDADKKSLELYDGHGSAMAQVYNHIIMPLANTRDKETQIIWGLYDFKKRFGRDAEGMWLAETAVDHETLELLVKHGVKYTVLAPNQAKRFKKIGDEKWTNGIDSNYHYKCNLPNGESITLFFYDGDRSQAVAFKGILDDGKKFAEELISGFKDTEENQLVHIGTDGESYGHHHKNGDMALAYCLRYIENNQLAEITNFSKYLSEYAPTREVEIHENSAWSCAHGVERWRSDCGCHTGGEPGWTQQWRQPLRDALDNLREQLAHVFEQETEPFLSNPWEVRNQYIEVIFNRSKQNIKKFLAEHVPQRLDDRTSTKIIRLLEMQRHVQLMYTSCGWFFNELSGIETVQILQYASRAIQLADSESSGRLEEGFLNDLSKANSNIIEMGSGKDIYNRFIKPYQLSLTQVGMHYAVASLFANNPKTLTVLNYNCESTKFERVIAGVQRLAIGTTRVNSKVTLSKKEFSFVVLYLGQHHLIGGTNQSLDNKEFETIIAKLKHAFSISNIAEVTDLIKAHFTHHTFSFFQMFKDEQLKMLNQVITQSEDQAYESYRKLYDINYNLLNVMKHQNLQIPTIMKKNIELVVNTEFKDLMEDKNFNIEKFNHLIKEVQKWGIQLDHDLINKELQHKLDKLMSQFKERPEDRSTLVLLKQIIQNMRVIGLDPNLINVQNETFTLSKRLLAGELQIDNKEAIIALISSIAEFVNIDLSGVKEKVKAEMG